jgi:hypothetical protein
MKRLSRLSDRLRDRIVEVMRNDIESGPEPYGEASVLLHFSDGSRLRATYWRLLINNRVAFSSFDHDQKYGLPAPIDAKADLQRALSGKECRSARMDEETGDLVFEFETDLRLQVFCFSSYEVWHISFPDGTGEYSNYALQP